MNVTKNDLFYYIYGKGIVEYYKPSVKKGDFYHNYAYGENMFFDTKEFRRDIEYWAVAEEVQNVKRSMPGILDSLAVENVVEDIRHINMPSWLYRQFQNGKAKRTCDKIIQKLNKIANEKVLLEDIDDIRVYCCAVDLKYNIGVTAFYDYTLNALTSAHAAIMKYYVAQYIKEHIGNK